MKSASGIQVHCRHDAIEKTAKIKPNPENPNEHPKEQIDKLVKIITRNGWRKPITISNRSGMVTKGHGRLMAAQAAGWEEVPVEYQRYRSDNEEWADVIADNQLAELGETDEAAVAQALQKLRETTPETIDATGYAQDELDRLLERLRGNPAQAKNRGQNQTPGPQLEDRKTVVLHYTVEEHEEFEQLVARAMKDLDLLTVVDTLHRLIEEEAAR